MELSTVTCVPLCLPASSDCICSPCTQQRKRLVPYHVPYCAHRATGKHGWSGHGLNTQTLYTQDGPRAHKHTHTNGHTFMCTLMKRTWWVKNGGGGLRWRRETQRGVVKAMSPGPAWTQMSAAWMPTRGDLTVWEHRWWSRRNRWRAEERTLQTQNKWSSLREQGSAMSKALSRIKNELQYFTKNYQDLKEVKLNNRTNAVVSARDKELPFKMRLF